MNTESFSTPWQTLGTVPAADLVEAKVQLHWAAQIVAALGNTLLAPMPDDSQSNLGWVDSCGALCSHPTSDGWRVGLRLADFTLLFLTPHNTIQTEFPLSGQNLQQGFEWLASTYSKVSGARLPKPFALREYDMPSHPVEKNAVFQLNPVAAFPELHHWYSNAHQVIRTVSKKWKEASPIRCWPHYFDIATLVSLTLPQNSGSTGTVGCGMSPGDASYAEPYFYVTVWPYPEKEKLPGLTVGKWHTEGFVAAVLTASDLISSGQKETQAERVHQFFQKSSELAFDALGASPS
jgi:hypothetical protein